MAIILPDDIKDISQLPVPQQIDTLQKYFVYLKEQLQFWGDNRQKEINRHTVQLTDSDKSIIAMGEAIENLEKEIESANSLIQGINDSLYFKAGDRYPGYENSWWIANGFATRSGTNAVINLVVPVDKSIADVSTITFASTATGGMSISTMIGSIPSSGYVKPETNYTCLYYKTSDRAIMMRMTIPNAPTSLVTRTPISAQILGNFVFT